MRLGLNIGPDFVLDEQDRLCHAPQPFDETDDDLMHDVCEGTKLAKPVQALLITLRQIDMTRDSFGVNAELSMKALYPILVKLREACIEEWRDQ